MTDRGVFSYIARGKSGWHQLWFRISQACEASSVTPGGTAFILAPIGRFRFQMKKRTPIESGNAGGSRPSAFSGLLPFFMAAHFGHHLVNSLPIPLLPMIRQEFSLDYTQAGLLISAFTLSYGLSQIPAGWFADRLGPRMLITIGICGVAGAGLLTAFSRSY
ncbi:MAG: MFS transporter, partial [Desulfobacteraceae bacterium]